MKEIRTQGNKQLLNGIFVLRIYSFKCFLYVWSLPLLIPSKSSERRNALFLKVSRKFNVSPVTVIVSH